MSKTCPAVAVLRRHHLAFSLLELCVVVALIAVLLALLVPALGGARDRARTAACLANLRQLGLAISLYAANHDNVILPAAYRDPAPPTPDRPYAVQWENWATLLIITGFLPPQKGQRPLHPAYVGAAPMPAGPFACPSGLTDAFSTNKPLWPADPIALRPNRQRSYATGIYVDTWYGINGATSNSGRSSGRGSHFLPARRIPADNDPTDTSLARFQQVPTTTVLLFDGVFMNQSAVDPFRLSGRHNQNRRSNLLLADGHAESAPRKDLPGGAVTAPATLPSPAIADYWRGESAGIRWSLPTATP